MRNLVVICCGTRNRYIIASQGRTCRCLTRNRWLSLQYSRCLIILKACIGRCKLRISLTLLLGIVTSRDGQRRLRDCQCSFYIIYNTIGHCALTDQNVIRTNRRGCRCLTAQFRCTRQTCTRDSISQLWISLTIDTRQVIGCQHNCLRLNNGELAIRTCDVVINCSTTTDLYIIFSHRR